MNSRISFLPIVLFVMCMVLSNTAMSYMFSSRNGPTYSQQEACKSLGEYWYGTLGTSFSAGSIDIEKRTAQCTVSYTGSPWTDPPYTQPPPDVNYNVTVIAEPNCPCGLTYSAAAQNCVVSEHAGECGPECPKAGNPIEILRGNKVQRETDFYVDTQNPFPLTLTREYSSLSKRSGIFGNKWRSDFDIKLYSNATEPGVISIQRTDGSKERFYFYGDISSWEPVDRRNNSLTQKADGTWTYIDEKSVSYVFDSQQTLQSITTRTGQRWIFTYSAGHIHTVIDSYGTQFVFTFTSGSLASIDTPDGLIKYTIVNNRLTSVTYPDNSQRHYLYENSSFPDALTGIIDENGHRYSEWIYDSIGRAYNSRHYTENNQVVGEVVIDFTYANYANPRVILKNELGKYEHYLFSEISGKRQVKEVQGIATVNCGAATKRSNYSPTTGWLSSSSNWNNVWTHYSHWPDGLEKERTEAKSTPHERTYYTEWDHVNQLKTLERLNNVVQTSYEYTTNNRIQKIAKTDLTNYTHPYPTNGNMQEWTYSYTYWDPGTESQIKSMLVDGPRTDVMDITTYEYSASGFLLKVTDALGYFTEVTSHDGAGRPLTSVDANGVQTTFSYTSRGWVDAVTVENGSNDAITKYDYDYVGQLIQLTSPNGVVLKYDYDGAHRLVKITDGDGNYIKYTLDKAGNRIGQEVKDGAGVLYKTHAQTFDELSRLRKVTGANGQNISYGYDSNDNLKTITDGKNNITTSTIDSLDRVAIQRDPNNFTVTYSHDVQGNTVSVTDQRGLVTSYQYDGLGNLMKQVSPDTGTTTYTYDAAGNQTSRIDARTVVSQSSYDALNRIISISYPASPAENVTYNYDDTSDGNKGVGHITGIDDANGRINFVYDALGQVKGKSYKIGNTDYTLLYSYDLSGSLTQITYPSGRLVNYIRDDQGRISSISTHESSGGPTELVVSNVAYLPFGPIGGYTYGNGAIQTMAYDQSYRLTGNLVTGGYSVLNLGYGYDFNNNISSISDNDNAAKSQSFQFDKLNRLRQAVGNYGNLNYQYDGVGNRTQQTIVAGGNTTSIIYSYSSSSNQLNQVAKNDGLSASYRNFQYSPVGNLVQDEKFDGSVNILEYNEANRYVELEKDTSVDATYSYNALGQRATKVRNSSGTVDHFHYNESGQLIAVSTDLGIPKREYIYLDSKPVGIVANEISTGSLYFIHNDHLGTPQVVTDIGQQAVWKSSKTPFGETTIFANVIDQPIRFPGQYFDEESEFNYNYFRDYDPSLGRYISSDPIGLRGGPNTYAYVGGNPLTYIDPLGLASVAACANPANAAACAAAGITPGSAGSTISNGGTVGLGLCSLLGICSPSEENDGTESKPDNCPTGTMPIDKGKKRFDLDKDDVHKIKKGVGAGPRTWTGIDPDGNVWTGGPGGVGENHGPFPDYL